MIADGPQQRAPGAGKKAEAPLGAGEGEDGQLHLLLAGGGKNAAAFIVEGDLLDAR